MAKTSFILISAFILLCTSLSGCATHPYDSNEYAYPVQIEQLALQGKDACKVGDINTISDFATRSRDTAQLYMLYTEHRLNDEKPHKAASGLYDISQHFLDTLQKDKTVSAVYCADKFQNLYDGAFRIARATATEEW